MEEQAGGAIEATEGLYVGTYRLADTTIRVESLHENVQELCRDYRYDGPPDLVVRISQDDIDFERKRSNLADKSEGRRAHVSTDGYLETLAVYRKIAEAMPARHTLLVHGSCVAVDGAAYLFCAPSGTGKSTHVRLWRELLGERAVMVNDDKPLVKLTDGGAIAYGTPWNGKHNLSNNIAVPLRAICLLERGESNHIERLSYADAYPVMLQQVYRPFDPSVLTSMLGALDRLIEGTILWRLYCNMDVEAARLSFSAMSGGAFS